MKQLLIILFVVYAGELFGQQYADKKFYLIDSLKLSELNQPDKILVDSCLEVFHNSQKSIDKLNALSEICANMTHKSWKAYQIILSDLILEERKGGKDDANKAEIESLYAGSLSNLAYIASNNGQIEKALKFNFKALAIQEQVKDSLSIATSLNNIGSIYESMHEYKLSLEYYLKCLAIVESLDDKYGLGQTYNSISVSYSYQKKHEQALKYSRKSLEIWKSTGNLHGIGMCLNSIGHLLTRKDSLKEGIKSLNEAVKIFKKIGDNIWLSRTYHKLAWSQYKSDSLIIAKNNVDKAFKHAKISKSVIVISYAAELYSTILKRIQKPKEALEMYELHIQMRDSINNEKTQKATIRQQTKYEFEKAQLLKEQTEREELRVLDAEKKRRDNLQYSIILVGILAVFGLVLSLGFISISPKFAEGLIFFAFLLLFEFLLVLSDPYIDNLTGGEPMYKLLLNAMLAGAIFPLHSFFERALKKKLVK